MKLVINIPDEAYKLLKSKSELDNIAESIIANGIPYDKVIDEVTELLENEWGYEGMKDDVSRIMRGGAEND